MKLSDLVDGEFFNLYIKSGEFRFAILPLIMSTLLFLRVLTERQATY